MEETIIQPYETGTTNKAKNLISLNYTNQDFWSLKSKLVQFIKERFGPNGTVLPNTFNDFVEADLGVMLMEIFAFVGDTLSFKTDQIANELFIDTVNEIENAFRLAKLVGFQPQPPIAARSLWSGTISSALTTELSIETPIMATTVAGDKTIRIELFAADINKNPIYDAPIIIPAGSTYNTNIVGLEGKSIIERSYATGEIGQIVSLNESPVIWDSIRVKIDGLAWEKVDYFTDSQPRREFRVEFDSNWNGYIIFGNNRAGLVPSQNSLIEVTYRVGGGTIGNIVTGAVSYQMQIAVPGLNYSVPVSFTNYTKGEFGYDGDTIDDVKRKLPLWIKTQNRIVTGEDYKVFCDYFTTPYSGSIGKSAVALREYGCAANIIDIYVLAKSGESDLQLASNELKVALNEELNKKKMMTDFICLKDGSVFYLDISIDVIMDKMYKKNEKEIDSQIRTKLSEFFSLNNWNYGQSLTEKNIIKTLSSIKELQEIDVNFTATNTGEDLATTVDVKFYEIIRPYDIAITFRYE